MSINNFKLCRLCMSTTYLQDLFTNNGDSNFDSLIYFCFGFKVQQGDGLPALICKDCLRKVKMFNSFKKACLEVNLKFKYMKENINNDANITTTNMQEVVKNNPSLGYNRHDRVDLTERGGQDQTGSISIKDENSKKHLILSNAVKNSNGNKKINILNKNSFLCELCGLVFKMKTVLEKHMTIHTGIKPFICKLCPKRFSRAENRMVHMRSHLGIKPYVCEICGSTSTKRQDLIRHMKIHSDERNYSCSVCNRHFKRSSDVISHLRTHTGLRPYKCNICEKTYTSHGGLRKHKATCKKQSNDEN